MVMAQTSRLYQHTRPVKEKLSDDLPLQYIKNKGNISARSLLIAAKSAELQLNIC